MRAPSQTHPAPIGPAAALADAETPREISAPERHASAPLHDTAAPAHEHISTLHFASPLLYQILKELKRIFSILVNCFISYVQRTIHTPFL